MGGFAPGVGAVARGAVGADNAPLVIWLRGMTANGSVGTGAGVPVVVGVVPVTPGILVVPPITGEPVPVEEGAEEEVVVVEDEPANKPSCRFAAIILL